MDMEHTSISTYPLDVQKTVAVAKEVGKVRVGKVEAMAVEVMAEVRVQPRGGASAQEEGGGRLKPPSFCEPPGRGRGGSSG